jgi:hypothetical protein
VAQVPAVLGQVAQRVRRQLRAALHVEVDEAREVTEESCQAGVGQAGSAGYQVLQAFWEKTSAA